MSIASRINEMTEHLRNDWDSIDKLGLDITEENSNDNLDKNIENIAPVLDRFYNQASDKIDLSENGVVGRTSQETTKGKNLFNVNATHESNLEEAGITATFNNDGTITVNGTKNANYKTISYFITLPAGTYYFSGCPSGGSGGGYSAIVQTTNEISSQIFDTGKGATFTLTEQKKISFFPVRVGTNAVTFNNAVFKPMIARVPVTYNDYEPYTGNHPSPSPDYPQEINNLSGDVEYKVRGKNLFDKSKATAGKGVSTSTGNLYNEDVLFSTDFIEITPNVSYVVNRYSTSANRVYGACYNASKEYLTNVTTNANISTFIVTNTNAKYIRLTGFLTDIDRYQLEQGTTTTPYEPYISESFPLGLKSKNLFDSNSKIIENFINNSGMTYTLDNGIYTLNGTNTQRYIYLRYNVELEPGSYIFTGCPKGGSFTGYSCIVRVGREPLFDYGDGISFTLTEKETVMVYPVRVGADSITVNNLQFKPMLEKVNNLFVGYDNMQSGFLPQSGSYPTTNSSNPNAKYQLIELKRGERVITSGSTSVLGRIRLIDKDTNEVYNTIQNVENEYLISTGNYTSGFNNGTITAKKDIILGIMILNSTFSSNFIISKISSYEPYYDIELCKIGDYQDSIKKSTGKNLFDYNLFNTFTSGNQTLTITLQPNTTYTMSSNIPAYSVDSSANLFVYNSGSSPSTSTNGVKPNTPRNVTTLSDGIIKITYRNLGDELVTPKTTYWYQIEEGSTATIYEPYGKVWYLNKQIGKVVLDGSENWEKHTTTAADIYMIFIPNSIGYEYGSGKIAPAICNSFIARALGSFPDNTYGVFGITPSLQTRFFVGATGSHYADINAWKQYLANNNMIVYFALATPTTTEITQDNYPTLYSQLLAIQEFLTKYKINKEFLLDYSSPEIEY